MFAGAFLDAVDPVKVTSNFAGGAEVEEEEDGGAREREELIALCEAFQESSTLFGKSAGGGGGGGAVASMAQNGAGSAAKVFKADNASFLVERICRYEHGPAGTPQVRS